MFKKEIINAVVTAAIVIAVAASEVVQGTVVAAEVVQGTVVMVPLTK